MSFPKVLCVLIIASGIAACGSNSSNQTVTNTTETPASSASPSNTYSPTPSSSSSYLNSPSPSFNPSPSPGTLGSSKFETTIQQQYPGQNNGATLTTLSCHQDSNGVTQSNFNCSFTDSNNRSGTIVVTNNATSGGFTWAVQ